MPYQREAEIVLAMLREIERRLESTEAGSPEAEALQDEIHRLRDEYRRLIDEARAHHRPEPPPLRDVLGSLGRPPDA
jgi:hypothetical protein